MNISGAEGEEEEIILPTILTNVILGGKYDYLKGGRRDNIFTIQTKPRLKQIFPKCSG